MFYLALPSKTCWFFQDSFLNFRRKKLFILKNKQIKTKERKKNGAIKDPLTKLFKSNP
jgi:hypothetical protein